MIPFASCLISSLFFQPIGAKSALPYTATFRVRLAALKEGATEDQVEAVLGLKGRRPWMDKMRGTGSGVWRTRFYDVDEEQYLIVRYRSGRGKLLFQSAELKRWRDIEPASAPALGAEVATEFGRGGGTVHPGRSPSAAPTRLVEGRLDLDGLIPRIPRRP